MITSLCALMDVKGVVPIGSAIPWLKSFGNTPTLPDEYVECNGQVLSDADSPYNGQAVPNLNGANSGTQRFLRGATISGGIGGSEEHRHTFLATSHRFTPGSVPYYVPRSDYTYYVSTLPSYYEVVNVLRIK